MAAQLSEQEIVRRNSLEEIKKLGIDPYPPELYEVNVTAKEILDNYERNKINYKNISIAGRIMSRRIMGNASFAELQDASGKIQLYIKRDEICTGEDKTLYNQVFKKHLDIGDLIGVKGYVFTTRVGEISIHVSELKLLCKSLRPLPIVKEKEGEIYDAFTDPEQRYRQRSLDLIVNPQVRDVFVKRAKVINCLREFLNERGYV